MQLNGRHHAIAFGFCLMLLPLSIGGVELPKSDRSAVDDSVQSAEAGIEFFKLKKEERPVILKHVPPVYPEQARRNKLTGKVFLRFRVAVDGTVDSVSVLKGADVFREAAIAAIRSIEFKPATSDGAPVPVWMAQVVRFDLDGVKAEGKEIQRPLMALMLNERGLLLMDGVPDKASTEVMMVELKRRLAVRDSRVVTMTANPKVSNDVLEAVIRRLRTLEIEIKVTIQ